MITKCLSVDLKEDNIYAVALHPGFVHTDMLKQVGAKGKITPDVSAKGMLNVMEHLTHDQNGKLFNYKGDPLPW